MYEWCHSGIEGYCKASADLLGTRLDGDSVLGLCRDLLPDRVAGPGLSHAWQFSNQRSGDRPCRQNVFEKLWLNDIGVQTYRDEAEMLASGKKPEGGFLTIAPGSPYEATLLACRDRKERASTATRQFDRESVKASTYAAEAELFVRDVVPEGGYRTITDDPDYLKRIASCGTKKEREAMAVRRCEEDAVTRCAQRVMSLLLDDDAPEASYAASLVQLDDFPVEFFTEVVPAIERGFLSERYGSADIHRFIQTLNDLIYNAHRCLTGGAEDDVEPFLRFVITLFAGLIYGPTHHLALNQSIGTTPSSTRSEYVGYDRSDGTTIRLTQIFDEDGCHTGYSELFRPSQAIFFGRSADAAEYVGQFRKACPEDCKALADREAVIFPIVLHPVVSKLHGMLLCMNDVWRYYDLGSTNGTSIVSHDGAITDEAMVQLRPGDRIRLGAPKDANDLNVYMDAAAIAVSSHVDLTEDFI